MGNDKLEKYEALDFINEHIIEGLEKKIILQNKMHNDLRAEIKELQADNKRNVDKFEMRVETLKNEVEEGRDAMRRLIKQVSSNSHNSSSTHTHTIAREIAEYMENNEGCGGARLFILPRDEFNDGEYDNTIYWDDGME
jgi:uncharacterized protein involved in exopolysaccharide biosynthesis